MDQRPIIHNNYCHHEAWRAVAFWNYDIEIDYVTMNPPNLTHLGETKTVDHEVVNLDQIEAEMRCAAAGEIAARTLFQLREELTVDQLVYRFTRDARKFSELGLGRDAEILKGAGGAETGPKPGFRFFGRPND